MKKLFIVLTFLTLSTIPAYAGDQSTYAVVDSNGVVTNVIACGPAVCGPNGSLGGVMPTDTPWAGQRLVLQVPENPVTGQTQGGYRGTPDNPVKYDLQAQVFTQGSTSMPAPVVVKIEIVDTTTVSATINSDAVTFGPDSFIDGQMKFTPVVTSTTGASISATQGTTNETQSFTNPQTKEQVTAAVVNKPLLTRYLSKVFMLLRGWILD